jgi:glycosyltransferase involved in cell wall biosynthesis
VTIGRDGDEIVGADHMAWNTAAHLAGMGHSVALVRDPPHPELPPPGLTVIASNAVTSAGGGLPRRPDVVHAFDVSQPSGVRLGMAVADACGAAFALTPATASVHWPDATLGRAACERADLLFALTRREAGNLRRWGAAPDRVRPLAQAPLLRGTPDPAAFRSRWGIAGPLVLFLGRRARFKGYPALLAAAPLVRAAVPTATTAFAGPVVDEEDSVTFAARRAPGVLDLGVLDEHVKLDALAACDVVCLPTTADVFPLVFVEAWTLGKPVVSGAFPGVAEVVRQGVDGIVTSTEPAALAATLVDLLRDEPRRATMSAAARQRSTGLTWSVVAHQVAAGYQAAVARSRAGAEVP